VLVQNLHFGILPDLRTGKLDHALGGRVFHIDLAKNGMAIVGHYCGIDMSMSWMGSLNVDQQTNARFP
jgi:hypothetical protein